MQFPDDPDHDLIYSYSRAQAIDDGILVDVSAHARDLGIRYPVAVTATLWHREKCRVERWRGGLGSSLSVERLFRLPVPH